MDLTDEERNVLRNTEFLQIKNQLSEKVVRYLSKIERALHQAIQEDAFDFPAGTFLKSGKISKGEQYKNLPYFILDYPRLFTHANVFAFRSMLWWGHEYSCTLHLQGDILKSHSKSITENLSKASDGYFCVNKQPWEYHFERDNYVPLEEINSSDISRQIKEHEFIKISDFMPLVNFSAYESFTLESFARFLRYIK